MKRITIADLARAADVSVSTVNRVLNAPDTVRKHTRDLVLATAAEIGFYGVGSLERSVRKTRETLQFGIILQQPNRPFYKQIGKSLRADAKRHYDPLIELDITYLEELDPSVVSRTLEAMAEQCHAIAVVAAQHQKVADAIDRVVARGVSVTALVAPLTATAPVNYVGLDAYKVGRTAAWAFDSMIKRPGEIGLMIGNHRYRNQELNESGFRSYFREYNPAFTVLEPRATYESSTIAGDLVEQLFHDHPELCGLFVSGGGTTGALKALKEAPKRKDFIAVTYEMFDATRDALIDGTVKMVISHPLDRLARQTLETMIAAQKAGPEAGAQSVALGFDIYTRENI